jgi:hypothetical protein
MINQEKKKCNGVWLAEKVLDLHPDVLLTCPDNTLPDHHSTKPRTSGPNNRFFWTFHTGS